MPSVCRGGEYLLSHPAGVRGLKYFITTSLNLSARVAPRRGAWIEICIAATLALKVLVAPRRGAWIEMYDIPALTAPTASRTPQGCVD